MAKRRPMLRAMLATGGGPLPWLFNGNYVLVSTSEAIPQVTGGTPRYWVRLYPDLPDQRVGSMWKGRLYRQWGNQVQLVYVEPPTIIQGRMRARVISAL